ncbi:MAG: hypothetical protein JSU06_01965 [Actinobacteria bacterium]|nr:hypothetical protein [Actinomycetota bacterium]
MKMQKTWNLTYYADGEPVAERNGISHSDAVVELYRLARGEAAPVPAEVEELVPAVDTHELALVA